jgi:hypothetical protein
MEGGEGGLTETEIRPIFKRIAEKWAKKRDNGNGTNRRLKIGTESAP